jgi:NTE family protein
MLEWASMRSRPDVREANATVDSRRRLRRKTASQTGHCACAWRRRGTRMGPYRRAARPRRGRDRDQHDRRHLDRRAGRRMLSRRQARRTLEDFARSLTKRKHLRPARLPSRRQRPARRHEARRPHARAHGRHVIRRSRRPFVCVATEIRTGHEIWLSSGSLITAMRASYALPGVFEPVTCNKRSAGRRRAGQPGPGLGLPRP